MQNEKVGIGQYLKNYIQQSKEVFKHPMKLLPTVVLGIVWIVIGYFSGKMELPDWAKGVSFLTYSEGGLFGGVLGAAGGIVGKVVMAVAVNSAILPLFEKKWPFVGVAGGIKGMFSNMGMGMRRGLAPLLCGVGMALLLYGFMNISENWINSMVGIVAVVMLLQNIGNQGGFLFGLLFSLANSLTKGRVPRFATITRFLTGMALGFTLGVGLTATGLHLCFLVGVAFLVLGLILCLFFNTKKIPEEDEEYEDQEYYQEEPQNYQQVQQYYQQEPDVQVVQQPQAPHQPNVQVVHQSGPQQAPPPVPPQG